jgi:hypothetical protein
VAWVLAGDTASDRFYRSAGWAPDGYLRRLTGDGAELREERLHVSLVESEEQE